MKSPNTPESSSQPQMHGEAVHQRERSLTELRYGVSLVAGRPLPGCVTEAIWELQSRLAAIVPGGLILPDPDIVHITVFRGRSSVTPCNATIAPPAAIAAALKGATPVTLAWSEITLDPDGAMRAYTSPSAWPFSSQDQAQAAAEALSCIFVGVHTSVQQRLWATLGTLRAAACAPDTTNEVRRLLSRRRSIPKAKVDRLKLLYYWDLQLTRADILEVYDLR